MKIREARTADVESIRRLHIDAFGETEGPIVSKLAIELLADETAKPLLNLVAEVDANIVGSIIFSSVKLKGLEDVIAYILAPLAVASSFQRKGVGRALIERGLQMLKEQDADVVFVLGDPRYYGKYGFSHNHRVLPPYELQCPESWMAISLRGDSLESVSGRLVCADSLNAPEYW